MLAFLCSPPPTLDFNRSSRQSRDDADESVRRLEHNKISWITVSSTHSPVSLVGESFAREALRLLSALLMFAALAGICFVRDFFLIHVSGSRRRVMFLACSEISSCGGEDNPTESCSPRQGGICS